MQSRDLTPWEPQAPSPLEILRPAWDLWAASYDAWARGALVWSRYLFDVATYANQKAEMLRHVQDRHDAGLTPWWW